MGRHGRGNDRKGERRKRGDLSGWTLEVASGVPVGPGISAPGLPEVMAALDRVGDGRSWPAVADLLVPLFQRVRPYPPGFPEPIRHILGNGMSVTFGIDTGPAFVHVIPGLLEDWERTIGDVAAQAMVNVRRRAQAVGPQAILTEWIGDLPVGVLQTGLGSASTFVLVPEELQRIFRRDRALFIAPMRDLLVALPPDTDLEVAAWLHAGLAASDPNFLAPLGFRLEGTAISVEALDLPAAIA